MKRHQKNLTIDISNNSDVTKRVENSWILLAKESLLESNEFNFIRLPHPAHRKSSNFCLDVTYKKIYEIVTFCESHRCWFAEQTVKSDSSVLILTPVNPIFFVLPYLRTQCNARAMPLKDLSSNKGFEQVIDFVYDLDIVADLKGPPDLRAYKYNESKTLLWLENKVSKLAKTLREKNIHVTSGAMSATFVASNVSSNTVDEDFFLKYALGIIAEYVESEIIKLLEKRFNFKPDFIESLRQKRKSEVCEGDHKRIKFDRNDIETTNLSSATQVSNNANKLKNLSAKEKARQKAASGTKTISAFFTKK